MFAYLDPATGGMMLQAAVATVAGVVVAGRLYWGRLKRGMGFGRDDANDGDEPR